MIIRSFSATGDQHARGIVGSIQMNLATLLTWPWFFVSLLAFFKRFGIVKSQPYSAQLKFQLSSKMIVIQLKYHLDRIGSW